jgi:hypothetical protein
MKKTLLILLILVIPMALFADVRLGPTAVYNFQPLQEAPPQELHITDFVFGADFRAKFFLFQVSAEAFYIPGYSSPTDGYFSTPGSIDLYTQAGIAFDLLILRFGLGAGPSVVFDINPNTEETIVLGANIRATADVLLGPVSVGLSYIMNFPFDFQDPQFIMPDLTSGSLGASVLFKL